MRVFIFCLLAVLSVSVSSYENPKSWIYYEDPLPPEPKKPKPEKEEKEVVVAAPTAAQVITAKETLRKIW